MHKQHSYTIGFVLSLICTFAAYFVVVNKLVSMKLVIPVIVGLALVQLFAQLYFFLHLGDEKGPRWNLMSFGFMAMVVIIVVAGSLWIMNNLNHHNYMTPAETETYMRIQSDKGF